MKASRSKTERAERQVAERVYGLAAAKAAFAARPDAVVSIAYTESLRHVLADMLRNAARRRIAYREVDEDELGRMAQSVHHEGICLLVQPRSALTPQALLESLRERGLLLALDGVQNPHNVGAILRSAAYFGVRGLIQPAARTESSQPGMSLSAAARRVAEGGAEHVPVLRVPELPALLATAQRAGITIIGSDAHAETSVDDYRWPARSLLVLGHEQHGLSREARAACQTTLRIAGSEHIDSLNVSVAAGIFLASYVRMHGAGTDGRRKS
ncbi:MAG: RNA methyltransferase [Polyangiales bacterium]